MQPETYRSAQCFNELKDSDNQVNVLSLGQVDTPDPQRLDKEMRQMFGP